jgi:hypothetical protein
MRKRTGQTHEIRRPIMQSLLASVCNRDPNNCRRFFARTGLQLLLFHCSNSTNVLCVKRRPRCRHRPRLSPTSLASTTKSSSKPTFGSPNLARKRLDVLHFPTVDPRSIASCHVIEHAQISFPAHFLSSIRHIIHSIGLFKNDSFSNCVRLRIDACTQTFSDYVRPPWRWVRSHMLLTCGVFQRSSARCCTREIESS